MVYSLSFAERAGRARKPRLERVTAPSFLLRASVAGDAEWMVELRADVMRPDLERLDRFDPVRVRERFLTAFDPEQTSVITVAGEDVGLIAVRPEADAQWVEHFYVSPGLQGRGLGSAVLDQVMEKYADH